MGRSGRLSLGAVLAALLAGQIAPNQLGAGAALCLAVVLVIRELRPRQARSLLPIVVGAGLIVLRVTLLPVSAASLDDPPAGDGPWQFVVESTGSPRDGNQTATLVARVDDGRVFGVAATLPRYPIVVPGDHVSVDGSIRARPDSPYGAYLLRIGAVGTLSSRTLTILPSEIDPGRRLESLRRDAAEALAEVLPEPEAGLAAGILIGLRDRVDRDLAAAFTTAGVSHVVAISGWNIAIVAAAVAAMTGRLGRRRRSVVTLAAIVAYVAFAGGSASVVRAGLMAGVVLLARESGRAGRAAAALGWAVFLLLLVDPGLIGDAGFQLSSLATAGLILWASPITTWLECAGGGRLPAWLTENLGVSLAAQAATLPIILVSFGRLAVLSPIVNLVVVPLVAPAMAVGLVALGGGLTVLGGAPAIVGAIAAAPGWVILRILVTIVELAANLPFATIELQPPLDLAMGLAAAMAVCAFAWWRRTRMVSETVALSLASAVASSTTIRPASAAHSSLARAASRASAIGLVVSMLVAGAVVAARPGAFVRVTILDVGQGDAILVEGSRGGRLLVDGGPDPDRLLVALDRRIPPWDRRIDAVILSHPHEDHVGGLALLLERYRVTRVFEPGMVGPGPGYAAWLRDLERPGSPVRLSLAAGDRLAVDEVELHVLWPIRGQVPTRPPDGGTGINNVSVVLLGQVGTRRFLLMGDVEEEIDPSLIKEGLPHVDLLKVAHHGSKTATTQAFIDATRPTVAVASAGAGNPYGHPARSTLERLAASGARVLRTDDDGTVVVGFIGDEMTTRLEGGRGTATGVGPVRAAATVPVVGDPISATLAVSASTVARAPSFLCAVPVTGLLPEPPRSAEAIATRTADPGGDEVLGRGSTVGYHRVDDSHPAAGGCLPDATRLLLGRRRTVHGARRRPLRGQPDRFGRRPDGPVGAARRAKRRRRARRPAQ